MTNLVASEAMVPNTIEVDASDLKNMVEHIMLLQQKHNLVEKGHEVGTFVTNESETCFGTELEVMVIGHRKCYEHYLNGKKLPKGEGFSWFSNVGKLPKDQMTPDGKVENKLMHRYTVVLPSEVAADGDVRPYQITLKGGSWRASSTINSTIVKALPCYGKVFKLTVVSEEFNGHAYKAFDVEVSRDSSQDELDAAKEWLGVTSAEPKAEAVKRIDRKEF